MSATPLPTDPMTEPSQHAHGHGGHGWLMMVCCIPMVLIAVALVAAGAVSASFLLWAGMCVVMMALMMNVMNHGDRHE